MLGNCYVCVCAVKPLTLTLSLRESAVVRESTLLLRLKRLFHPAIELLLVGFDPAIHVAFDICFG